MENKLFHQVYLSINPTSIKKGLDKAAKLKNVVGKDQQPKVYIDKMDQKNGGQNSQEELDLNNQFELQQQRFKELSRISLLELENKNLIDRIKELEKINIEKTFQNYQIKQTLDTERKLFEQWRFLSSQRIKEDNQIMTIERFIKEIQNTQQARSSNLRKTVQSSKQYDSQDSIWSFTSDAEKWKKRTSKFDANSETEISPKCLIISIMKELQYIYNKMPEDCGKKFEPILNQNEEIFINVVNNKIRLNQILEQ